MKAEQSKPLSQWIIESIDEELRARRRGRAGLTGRQVYLRGVERYEQSYSIRTMAERLRARRRELPLLGATGARDE